MRSARSARSAGDEDGRGQDISALAECVSGAGWPKRITRVALHSSFGVLKPKHFLGIEFIMLDSLSSIFCFIYIVIKVGSLQPLYLSSLIKSLYGKSSSFKIS